METVRSARFMSQQMRAERMHIRAAHDWKISARQADIFLIVFTPIV